MKAILLILLLPVCAFGQKGNSFFGGSLQVETHKDQSASLGIRIAGGANLDNTVMIGATVGFTKFARFDDIIIPIGATFMAGAFNKKIFPVAILEPTYAIYTGGNGGFSFYGGGGIGISSGKKGAALLTAGYSSYNLKTGTIDGLGFRITFLGK